MNDEIMTYDNYNTTPHLSESAQVANPFGSVMNTSATIGAAQAVSHELAEMQAQIYLAKQFPRDQRKATEQILTACQRQGLAQVAVYSYARGGSAISGPSIRLAEEIARDWCNLECGWNEMERENDASKVRAFAWDKESNVLKTLYFYVPHYRTTKTGRKRITDERDLYELLANQAARRMRNCILALIPGDVVDAAVAQCEKTMVTSCEITPETIKKLVQAFNAFGVSRKQIEKRIQRNIESITPAQFVRMREIYTSMKDGISDATDWFDPEDADTSSASEALTESLKAGKVAGRVGRPRKKPDAEPSQDETNSDAPVTAVDEFRRRTMTAKTEDELKQLADEVTKSNLSDDDKTQVFHLIDEKAMDFE